MRGVRYPATKDELIAAATKNGAPPEVMSVIRRLSADRFGGPQEVMKSYSADHRPHSGS